MEEIEQGKEITQRDQDQVVNPIDTITYAKKHGIRIAVLEGTDDVYKKPEEKASRGN